MKATQQYVAVEGRLQKEVDILLEIVNFSLEKFCAKKIMRSFHLYI